MRLFVAIQLSDETRTALDRAQTELRKRCTDVRFLPLEQLHVTMKFLGEVPEADVPVVTEVAERAAQATRPFEMSLDGCGCFPARGPVRIVWAGLVEKTGVLCDLAESLEAALEPLGFARERRTFSPHITIGRVRADRSGDRLRRSVDTCRMQTVSQSVSSAVLMSSTLSPEGASYTPIATLNFV